MAVLAEPLRGRRRGWGRRGPHSFPVQLLLPLNCTSVFEITPVAENVRMRTGERYVIAKYQDD
jgi:hypothetical protein